MKTCSQCGEVKPITEYWKNIKCKNGLTPSCKDCHRRRAEEWRKNNPEAVKRKLQKKREYEKSNPEKAFSRRIKYEYGIDGAEWNKILARQNGCCAICRRHQSILSRILQVDHCHKTGKVRGLLCTKCNTKLAAIENGDYMIRALAYLEKH